jgi:DHA1 family tetracycline resistance protein-like MFS transporter
MSDSREEDQNMMGPAAGGGNAVATPPPKEENEEGDLVSRATLLALAIAYLSVFIDILGVSIVLPIIPFLAIRFDASAQQIGFIYAGYAGAQMLSVPISGKLSDRFGRRPLMLASLFGSFAGFLFQGLAWNIVSFICARVVAGTFGGSIPITQSYIADVIPAHARGRYFAILGSVVVGAFLFGPGIGAGLSQFSLRTPFFVASSLAGCGWILAFFFFQEPKRQSDPAAAGAAAAQQQQQKEQQYEATGVTDSEDLVLTEGGEGGSTSNIVADSGAKGDNADNVDDKYLAYQLLIRMLWLVSFFQMFAFSSIIYFFGLFVYDEFGWQPLEVGFSWMLMGVFQVAIQMLCFPQLLKKFGEHFCGTIGCCMCSIGLLMFSYVSGSQKEFTGLPLMALSMAFLSFGNAVIVPSLSAVLSQYSSASTQGSTLGIAQAMEALARTVGPLLWGAVYTISRHLPFQISTGLYAVAAIIFSIVLVLNYNLKKKSAAALAEQRVEEDNRKAGKARLMGSSGIGASNVELSLMEADSTTATTIRRKGRSDSKSSTLSASLHGLPLEEQVCTLEEENRLLRERLQLYEQTLDLVGVGGDADGGESPSIQHSFMR